MVFFMLSYFNYDHNPLDLYLTLAYTKMQASQQTANIQLKADNNLDELLVLSMTI